MYEKLRSMYENEPSITQELISPVSFEYNSRDFEILMDYSPVLKELGFEIEPFGKNTILVRSVPTVFGRMEDREVINDILDDLLSLGRVRGEDLQREKFIQIAACKSAIKAGERLNMHEIVELLKMIPDLSSPFNCAHGRPTILAMTLKELEKQFRRIV
jgi:DNA mismatch repair protein MutL